MKLRNIINPLVCILLVLGGVLFLYSSITESGDFSYVLDDPYIHMELANNLVENSTYGINPGEFSSPSSSPIWTFLLSASIKAFGNSESIPFYLNILFTLVLILVFNYLIKGFVNQKFSLYLHLNLILSGPLIALIYVGMEHTLHILMMLLFFVFSSNYLINKKSLNLLLVLVPILPLLRFESCFMILIFGLILLFRKDYKAFILISIISLLPLIIFGIISKMNGSFILPNSVLLKNSMSTRSLFFYAYNFGYKWIANLAENPHILVLFILSFYFFVNDLKNKTEYKDVSLMLVLSVMLHSIFARFGWFYRYESYLMVLMLYWVGIRIYPMIKEGVNSYKSLNKALYLFLIVLVSFPIIGRGFESYNRSFTTAKIIASQQHKMAAFIKNHMQNKRIAVNDIGAIAYYTDNYVLDLYGLATNDVAKLKLDGEFNSESISKLLDKKEIDLLMIYDNWFNGDHSIPDNWVKIAEWEHTLEAFVGEKVVSFYIKDINNIEIYKQGLVSFEKELNSNTIVRYY